MSDEATPNEERPDIATRFTVGNEAWKARSSHGRKPKFESPDVLEAACDEYFEWVCANPLMAVELVKFQGIATQVQVPKMRAMTIGGLCNFLDMDRRTWTNYKERPDFIAITTRAEGIIFQQKIEGAAADMLNANIIARETGLADKQDVTHEGIPDINIYLPENGRDQ